MGNIINPGLLNTINITCTLQISTACKTNKNYTSGASMHLTGQMTKYTEQTGHVD